jgi:hypothetical protein
MHLPLLPGRSFVHTRPHVCAEDGPPGNVAVLLPGPEAEMHSNGGWKEGALRAQQSAARLCTKPERSGGQSICGRSQKESSAAAPCLRSRDCRPGMHGDKVCFIIPTLNCCIIFSCALNGTCIRGIARRSPLSRRWPERQLGWGKDCFPRTQWT